MRALLGLELDLRRARVAGHGALATTFWVQVVGLALVVPFAIGNGVPDAPTDDWLLALLAGVAYLGGSACWTFAVRLGAVGIVTMLVATDGAIAATTSALLGETVGLAVGAALAVVVAGVLLATRPGEHARVTRAAVCSGCSARSRSRRCSWPAAAPPGSTCRGCCS